MTTFEQVKREAAMRHEKAQGGRASDNLTLRDYFAAKAMAAQMTWMGQIMSEGGVAACAYSAYEMADAMLKAREA